MRLIVADPVPPSPARTRGPRRAPWRIGAVQHRWHPDAEQHAEVLADGVATAAGAGARLVCLQELTLSPYVAADPAGPEGRHVPIRPEPRVDGPTHRLAARLAATHDVHVSASLWEADPAIAPRGWNTQICVDPDGAQVAATRKLHIPVTAGYREDLYFAPGEPVEGDAFPVAELSDANGNVTRLGFPTCWDQWFPEVTRAYALAGADVLVYPTAIGSEPDHPDFDTRPLWQQVMVANGIANGVFMVAVNRIGSERCGPDAPTITFYGSSFISDPYGRVLVQAPRDEPAAIVADLDLDAGDDWLGLFPFLATRRPDVYGPLVDDWPSPPAGRKVRTDQRGATGSSDGPVVVDAQTTADDATRDGGPG